MTDTSDLSARMREVERTQAEHGADLAGLKATVANQSELVRAIAPLVGDLATVRGVASSALEKANANNERQDEFERVSRDDRARRVATLLTILTVVIALLGLVVVVLQFSGLGHG